MCSNTRHILTISSPGAYMPRATHPILHMDMSMDVDMDMDVVASRHPSDPPPPESNLVRLSAISRASTPCAQPDGCLASHACDRVTTQNTQKQGGARGVFSGIKCLAGVLMHPFLAAGAAPGRIRRTPTLELAAAIDARRVAHTGSSPPIHA